MNEISLTQSVDKGIEYAFNRFKNSEPLNKAMAISDVKFEIGLLKE